MTSTPRTPLTPHTQTSRRRIVSSNLLRLAACAHRDRNVEGAFFLVLPKSLRPWPGPSGKYVTDQDHWAPKSSPTTLTH